MADTKVPPEEVPTTYSAQPSETVPKLPVPRNHPERSLGYFQPNLPYGAHMACTERPRGEVPTNYSAQPPDTVPK